MELVLDSEGRLGWVGWIGQIGPLAMTRMPDDFSVFRRFMFVLWGGCSSQDAPFSAGRTNPISRDQVTDLACWTQRHVSIGQALQQLLPRLPGGRVLSVPVRANPFLS